ncbi:hypothetical protein [Convivina praedatoris]|uniref:Uncharacterized protein n=1 Tax=Convivina praedatoris TaxID=2880963 RepID=A0ABN8H7Z0_9LACO|nr:hypothetical protein [Convivina sp. LMG 32447]CAH1851591.1 hypothetical protein LMG032447_00355 [Convivina sp. LMG 32447]CAH1851616.1 hypothetical protein R078138_00365 [Convivina sp. LMG 32447]CAH1853197.1 hypothetical protein R077815_00752 [Convivina sp. LMG 32447]
MREVAKINWIAWIKGLKPWQAWLISLFPLITVLLIETYFYLKPLSYWNQNRLDGRQITMALYIIWLFTPIETQLRYRRFPSQMPDYQYQVATWFKWFQELICAGILFIIFRLYWSDVRLMSVSFQMVLAIYLGYCFVPFYYWFKAKILINKG